jgi:hypothetical protein
MCRFLEPEVIQYNTAPFVEVEDAASAAVTLALFCSAAVP